jgi:hypothetical protein
MDGLPRAERERIRKEQDAPAMMRHPSMWPHTKLPMKKRLQRNGLFQLACFYGVHDTGHVTLYLNDNLYGPQKTDCSTIRYDSPEACVADGWEVD